MNAPIETAGRHEESSQFHCGEDVKNPGSLVRLESAARQAILNMSKTCRSPDVTAV